jgi:hypothetical protein
MADISIHNTKSIVISEVREINGTTPLYTRDITITDARGQEIIITCFSTSEEAEELRVML